MELFIMSCFSLDFEEVLKLEPGNKQAFHEMKKIAIVRMWFRAH